MKTFKEFCEQVNRPVNSRQAFPMDATTQRNLNAAISPGKKPQKPVTFRIEPVSVK